LGFYWAGREPGGGASHFESHLINK
jgi:hypothetical protein